MQNVGLNGKGGGELDLQQATEDQAAPTGQVLEVVRGVAVSVRRPADVVAGKIRGQARPSDHAPIEPLAGGRGGQGQQESDNQPGGAHGRSDARREPERQETAFEVFNRKLCRGEWA